jgi:hypothetical protein
MRRRPSPSLVLSVIAVVFSLAGTSVAAINYARNAGAVDHKSAVGATSSRKRAAGKLVATAGSGPLKGQIPSRFLDLGSVLHGSKATFHQSLPVTDNAQGAPVTIGGFPGLGTLTAACDDQNTKAGLENPEVRLAFANGSGQTLNVARSVGNQTPSIVALAPATQDTFSITANNVFRDHIELNGANYVAEGVVRQDGTNTANGTCQVYGYALLLPA